ncbi:uncharacterized protein LOC117282363 [Cryptotermes secundus]|uniref:uncharacterized protein LOC117282363 n=1 Tax=Cryptotermes secundus TaxID=105785 RepID=UPI001454DCB5|nr:uncharacterized protein LOC117282363 [Cryptotermes secundus]
MEAANTSKECGSDNFRYNCEESYSGHCLKCIYLEEQFQETLSELNSLKLAIKLFYSEINMTHTGNEVRFNPGITSDETSSPTWCNVNTKHTKSDNKPRRFESLQSIEPVATVNRFAPLSNLPDNIPKSDKIVTCDVRRLDSTTPKAKKIRKLDQCFIYKRHESQCNQHCPCQAVTATNMEAGSVNYQRSGIKYYQIQTIINGYINPPQMSVPSKPLIGDSNEKFSKIKREHKVLIYGDSHARGLSARLKNKLPDAFEVTGYTKPNCGLQTLLSTTNQEIVSLSNNDVLVIVGGINDLNSDNSSRVLWHISQFVKQNSQTNIILLTAAHRYDQSVNIYI